jgi:hypothetical protein
MSAQMGKNHFLLLGLVAVMALLVTYTFWQGIAFAKKEQAISRVLGNYDGFKRLSFAVSKPGYHRISGKVNSTNDLNRLKNDLRTAKIRKVILLVEVEPGPNGEQ